MSTYHRGLFHGILLMLAASFVHGFLGPRGAGILPW